MEGWMEEAQESWILSQEAEFGMIMIAQRGSHHSWIISRALEMAGAYPTAEIVSLDVSPLTSFVPHPRITFEVYDLYAGITEPDASFDVIRARQCIMLVRSTNFDLAWRIDCMFCPIDQRL